MSGKCLVNGRNTNACSPFQNDGLRDQHRAAVPAEQRTKKALARDLLLVFSERVTVSFKTKGGLREMKEGRWCEVCRSVSHVVP